MLKTSVSYILTPNFVLASQGKLSRQIANLKQTLKHTTENTMQLDSSIDQRLRELEDINREIQQNRDVSDQEEQMTQQNYYELLAAKMEKSKVLYQTVAYQIQQKQFNDVSTGRYRAVYQDENEARSSLDQCRSKNMMIEEVLDKIRNENPDLDVILNKCIGW